MYFDLSGDEICVSDPEGNFDASRLRNAANMILIAAGTGKLILFVRCYDNSMNINMG